MTKKSGKEFDACVAELPPSNDPRWLLWGPYMSNREWGTVRETGGPEGTNWTRFPYEKAAKTAYRYCEDGIFGVCDRECRVCHAYAFWNYRDDHLKERFYGLDNSHGAHGEDVKDLYYYKAADPQYRYLCAEYLYPQPEFPYRHLESVESRSNASEYAANAARTAAVSLADFNNWHRDQRYFECEFEMCKLTPEQLYMQLSVTNCGNETARLVVLPMLFLRNTWSPGYTGEDLKLEKVIRAKADCLLVCFRDSDGNETQLGYYYDTEAGTPEILLTDNETVDPGTAASKTNGAAGGEKSPSPGKDAFHRYIVRGDGSGLLANLSNGPATRAGLCYRLKLQPKQQVKIRCFLMSQRRGETAGFNWRGLTASLDMVRLHSFVEACDALPTCLVPAEQDIVQAAFTNLLWNRQYYPLERMPHLWWQHAAHAATAKILPTRLVTVPDKWEQPYLASWDTALHCLCLNCFDRPQALWEFLLLLSLIRADGSIYADEYRPEAVTPPVIVLTAIDIFNKCSHLEKQQLGPIIYTSLKRHLNWWLERLDAQGVSLLAGGVCGVDYVSLFQRDRVETGEGLTWALFFTMRFLELSLAIYATPGCDQVAKVIGEDLPTLISYVGRLCAAFVRNIAQENGLYHPYWLDVKACQTAQSLSTAAKNDKKQCADKNDSNQCNGAENKGFEDEKSRRCFSSASMESAYSVDGSQISFSSVVQTGLSKSAMANKDFIANYTAKQRCEWLHAYCYLPVICCCSLPNVQLCQGGGQPSNAATLEDLFAEAFNGPADWETRAPYVFTDAGHTRLFVTAINSQQLAELLEQVLSEIQFLSQYGIRTMSMLHTCDKAVARLAPTVPAIEESEERDKVGQSDTPGPTVLEQEFCPGASVSASYGGNTNWYGGVNLPYNYLVLEALHKWSTVLDKKFDLIECPSYTGRYQRLKDIVQELASRNVALFVPNANGIVPSTGDDAKRGTPLCETFDGDTGRGHGATHKGGWSAIIVRILMIMHDLQ